MGDHKRSAPTFAAMEASSGATVSKKRKTSVGSCQLQLRSSDVQLENMHLEETTVSPATSVNSFGTVVSGEFFTGRFPLSCSSSSNVVEDSMEPLDLETNVFETVDSTYSNFKLFSKDRYLLSEFCGDSEEMTMFPAKPSTAAAKFPAVKMAPKEEIEEFFAMAEKYEQKRFAEKYNYDIVKDKPLQGTYQWVRLI